MPANGQSIGKDVKLRYVLNGVPLRLGGPSAITSFEPRPTTTTERRKGLNGKTRNAVFHDGWEATIDIDRLDSSVDNFWAALEAAYYAGQDTGSGTATETITNPDGSISQFRYTNVVFDLETLGQRVADKVIAMKLKLFASRRLQIL